jgi:hypothetical protein
MNYAIMYQYVHALLAGIPHDLQSFPSMSLLSQNPNTWEVIQ